MAIVSARVTRSHIDTAEEQDSHKCAIAQAICDSDPDILWADVRWDFVRFARESDDLIYKFRSPKAVSDFIKAFDEGRGPRPFTATLGPQSLVSIHPRWTGQRQKNEERSRRKRVAKATGRHIRSVKPEEVETFDSEGWAEKPTRGARKSKTATTGVPRKNNHRPTAAEAFRS